MLASQNRGSHTAEQHNCHCLSKIPHAFFAKKIPYSCTHGCPLPLEKPSACFAQKWTFEQLTGAAVQETAISMPPGHRGSSDVRTKRRNIELQIDAGRTAVLLICCFRSYCCCCNNYDKRLKNLVMKQHRQLAPYNFLLQLPPKLHARVGATGTTTGWNASSLWALLVPLPLPRRTRAIHRQAPRCPDEAARQVSGAGECDSSQSVVTPAWHRIESSEPYTGTSPSVAAAAVAASAAAPRIAFSNRSNSSAINGSLLLQRNRPATLEAPR